MEFLREFRNFHSFISLLRSFITSLSYSFIPSYPNCPKTNLRENLKVSKAQRILLTSSLWVFEVIPLFSDSLIPSEQGTSAK